MNYNIVAIIYALITVVMFVVVAAEILTLKHYHDEIEQFLRVLSDNHECMKKEK